MTEVYAGLQALDSIDLDLHASNQDALDLGSRVFSPHASACGCGVCGFRGPAPEAAVAPGSYRNLAERGYGEINGKDSLSLDGPNGGSISKLTTSSSTWSANAQQITITYAFRATDPGAISETGAVGFSRFNAEQIRQTELSLLSWSDVSGIRFNRIGSGDVGEGAYSNLATILFANYSGGGKYSNAGGFAFGPSIEAIDNSNTAGDIWIRSTYSPNSTPNFINEAGSIISHEIGHAIGLSHPGKYDLSPGIEITYQNNAEYFEDSKQYTIMSYFSEKEYGRKLQKSILFCSID